ncbi:MAG TPA: hypothetical protein VLV49_18990 [Terriglobales bacterium]|nr:hypothetical protein [Terriglobales bacterium]
MKARAHLRLLIALLLASAAARAQQVTVTARVAWINGAAAHQENSEHEKHRKPAKNGVVVWLVPIGAPAPRILPASLPHPRLVQKNKSFQPHLLVVPVGSLVEFPNRDPFFHNVFSLFEGKRFDLGLYEAGSTRDVLFDKPGVSYIFCNIHAEMSAVVIALQTPYYAISDLRGQIAIPLVPAGHYTMHVWYEAALPETLNSLAREVTVSEGNPTLGLLGLPTPGAPATHLDKYGQEYNPSSPINPAYQQP